MELSWIRVLNKYEGCDAVLHWNRQKARQTHKLGVGVQHMRSA